MDSFYLSEALKKGDFDYGALIHIIPEEINCYGHLKFLDDSRVGLMGTYLHNLFWNFNVLRNFCIFWKFFFEISHFVQKLILGH